MRSGAVPEWQQLQLAQDPSLPRPGTGPAPHFLQESPTSEKGQQGVTQVENIDGNKDP